MRRFAYRLALRLGHANVDVMLRSMTCLQFYEWLEFARVEPFGEDRADARAASIVQMVANVHRDPKKRRAMTLAESSLKGGDAFDAATLVKPRQSWETMKMIAQQTAAAYALPVRRAKRNARRDKKKKNKPQRKRS